MLITPMICLTIINWLMAGSGMREAGSYYCADNYYFFLIKNIQSYSINLNLYKKVTFLFLALITSCFHLLASFLFVNLFFIFLICFLPDFH
jgi:hypothetical protein